MRNNIEDHLLLLYSTLLYFLSKETLNVSFKLQFTAMTNRSRGSWSLVTGISTELCSVVTKFLATRLRI